MITVWLAAFPAMFYGMYNLGFRRMVYCPGQGVEGWHGFLIPSCWAAVATPSSIWDCLLVRGSLLPADLYRDLPGGYQLGDPVCHSARPRGQQRASSSPPSCSPDLPPDIPLWQVALGISFGVVIGKGFSAAPAKNFLNPPHRACFPVLCLPGADVRRCHLARGRRLSPVPPPVGCGDGRHGGAAAAVELDGRFPRRYPGLHRRNLHPGDIDRRRAAAAHPGGSWRIIAGVMIGMVALSTLFNLLAPTTTCHSRCPGTGTW